ncbi:TLC domain-containing protein 3A-like [Amphiura filiformis]|uniref:TLC domain-containing protein 3A-like n=1 Tax=Amphiura filiformis TaxID=82378 RepID=UPI003B219ACE
MTNYVGTGMLRIVLEIGRFIPGFLLFPWMFVYIRQYFRSVLQNKDDDYEVDRYSSRPIQNEGIEWDANTIATRLVSAINAVLMSIAGIISVYTTWNDLKFDRSPVLEPYVYLCLPYMMYDLWAMFVTYQSEKPLRKKQPLRQSLRLFYMDNTQIVTHHIFIALVLCPVYLYLLNGIGDFVVGTFCLAELSTPFLSLRVIIKQLKLDMPKLSLANDILFTVLFFICRVLMMPFCYWSVGRYFGVPFLGVPFFIPIKCNVVSGMLWGMQLLWFYKIFKKMLQLILGFSSRSTTHKDVSHSLTNGKVNGHEINCNIHNHND